MTIHIEFTNEQLLAAAKVLRHTSAENPIFASVAELDAFEQAREVLDEAADVVILGDRAARHIRAEGARELEAHQRALKAVQITLEEDLRG